MASDRVPTVLPREGSRSRVVGRDMRGYPTHDPGDESICCGAHRGELLKLGIEVAQSTVAKYMTRSGRGRSQTWKTFLHNHAAPVGAMDFLSVPTVGFRLLFVLSSSGTNDGG
jgi:hypothetical protein